MNKNIIKKLHQKISFSTERQDNYNLKIRAHYVKPINSLNESKKV